MDEKEARTLVNKFMNLAFETGRNMGAGVSILTYTPLIIERDRVGEEIIDALTEGDPMFDRRETAAILAGLRSLQCGLDPDTEWRGELGLVDILTGCGSFKYLTIEEIDELCERINVGEIG